MLVEEFIEQTNAAANREEVFSLYLNALSDMGFDQIVYSFITDHNSCGQKAGHGIQNNFPMDWMNYYNEQNYGALDPAVHNAFRTAAPFTWDELKKATFLKKQQVRILLEAEEAGLNDGVGIPLYGPNGEIAGVGLSASAGGINPDKNMLCKLKAITEQFHLTYCSIDPQPSYPDIPKLTPTELEVLKWLAKGKTSEDLAIILNTSVSGIKFHVKNIYKKLNANSRILAVLKAIHFGILSFDTIATSIAD